MSVQLVDYVYRHRRPHHGMRGWTRFVLVLARRRRTPLYQRTWAVSGLVERFAIQLPGIEFIILHFVPRSWQEWKEVTGKEKL